MSQEELVGSFQAISGRNESTSRSFLSRANWNLEQALSNYFESGSYSDETPLVLPPSQQPQQPTQPQTTASSSSSSLRSLVLPPDFFDDGRVGLFDKSSKNSVVPLKGISVEGQVIDGAADLTIGMKYTNNTDSPIEAVFLFSQEDSTIYGLTVETEGKTIVGVCKAKEEAAAAYDDGIASGHSAFLLEKDDTKNLFKLNVGNLAPGQESVVLVKYVSELQQEGDALRLVIPVTRMTPLLLGSSQAASGEPDQASNAKVKDGFHANIQVRSTASPIGQIENASGFAARVESSQDHSNEARVVFDSSKDQGNSFESMKILITLADPRHAQLCFEPGKTSGQKGAVMLGFYPGIKQALRTLQGDAFSDEDYEPFSEFIFLVDRSGSMAGSRMNQAKNALHLFLRSLPEGTQFNIVGFGNSFEKLFPESVEYDDRSFKAASAHVDSMTANLGGTNIMSPLRDILGRSANPDYPRQIFCLTDGEVNNTADVIEYVGAQSKGTRVFTFGIGADASPQLVKGIAKASRGEAEFVASGSRLEAKVLRQLQRALQPALKNVVIEWGDALRSDTTEQAPDQLGPLYDSERTVVYAFVDASITLDDLQRAPIVVKAQTADSNSVPVAIPVHFDRTSQVDDGANLVHRLAASARLRDLGATRASQQTHKEEITKLGVEYSIATRYTSFVAVVARGEATEGTMQQIDINEALLNTAAGPSADVAWPQIADQLLRLQRDESLDCLLERSEELSSQARAFTTTSASARMPASELFSSFFGGIGNMVSSSLKSLAPVSGASAPSRRRSSHTIQLDALDDQLDSAMAVSCNDDGDGMEEDSSGSDAEEEAADEEYGDLFLQEERASSAHCFASESPRASRRSDDNNNNNNNNGSLLFAAAAEEEKKKKKKKKRIDLSYNGKSEEKPARRRRRIGKKRSNGVHCHLCFGEPTLNPEKNSRATKLRRNESHVCQHLHHQHQLH
eukprot:TRINITY_DN5729_c1_g2_i1.p1 TRINITY_DN5729_c1_g2~~TRINITY_DN5729_c1_g2_i1.p1  ORF type:complete len:965 (+),score=193.97 TRINITY_DN5729_c1_g2_i1:130-3024(+)